MEGPKRETVLLLHGMGRTGASMTPIAAALKAAGYATMAPTWPWRRPLADAARHVARALPEGAAPLHIVTHSLGGLLARALICADRPGTLGRVVMLAPPNGGSGLADALVRWRLGGALGPAHAHLVTWRSAADEALLGPVDYPLGIIAGTRSLFHVPARLLAPPHDGKVSVAATGLAGMADHLVLPLSHWMLPLAPAVHAAIRAFLAAGAFRR